VLKLIKEQKNNMKPHEPLTNTALVIYHPKDGERTHYTVSGNELLNATVPAMWNEATYIAIDDGSGNLWEWYRALHVGVLL
jgi:hypothetical protein